MKTTVFNSDNREAIVFLNPMGTDTRFWKNDFPKEILDKYETIFVDYPGYNSDFHKYASFSEVASDVCETVLSTIHKPVHLIGYSYGGFLAQHIVNRDIENIKSLVIIGASYKLNPINVEINSILKTIAKDSLMLFCKTLSVISHEANEINQNPLLGLQKYANLKISVKDSEIICNQLEHLLKHKKFSLNCDPTIDTLIIYGENDKMISDYDMNYYRNYFETLKIIKLKRESHMIPTENIYPLLINHLNTAKYEKHAITSL